MIFNFVTVNEILAKSDKMALIEVICGKARIFVMHGLPKTITNQ